MLEKADLKVKCSKEEYENIEEGLLERIGCLQRRLREKGIPVIILFDGWHASLRGRVISSVLAGLDPRGFRVRSAAKKNACTEGLPYMTRFWTELPAQGSIAIYNNSWYYGLFEDKADSAKKSEGAELKVHAEDVNVFEKQLADGGYLLIKIFLQSRRSGRRRIWKNWRKHTARIGTKLTIIMSKKKSTNSATKFTMKLLRLPISEKRSGRHSCRRPAGCTA
jgi:polyphosphate kinase 2 (PPK2 family)